MDTGTSNQAVNLGIYDGDVAHDEVNGAIATAGKSILFGQQTRLPHFPEDQRLPKLHSGHPLVLLFWKVLKKVPEHVRQALIGGPISVTLVRDDSLLCFRDCRHHQAVHLGRRRRTIYLPEVLLYQAEEMGYDYWAIAEGVIYAGWMLLDYLLLVEVLRSFGDRGHGHPNARLTEPYLKGYVREHNRHRQEHPEEARSEVFEFVEGYRSAMIRTSAPQAFSHESFQLARDVFDAELEQRWARGKMERIADIFDYPRLFLFDRDIIHGAARELARRRGQQVEPASFADVLHDYRDSTRFDRSPIMTTFCKGVVPKPRAQFLRAVVDMGVAGLKGFFAAYRAGEPELQELVHPLWMYLCSLSSDPAGVFTRVGRCRALGRFGMEDGMDRPLAGIVVRLDRAPGYRQLVAELPAMGETARQELHQVIGLHRLRDADEWSTFRIKKQAIVASACEILDRMEEGEHRSSQLLLARRRVHEEETIVKLLEDSPHRLTSDPSSVLMYVRTYKRTLREFGPADPDTNALLASILIRLDLSDKYEELVKKNVPLLGPPAVSALYGVLEQVADGDEKRQVILQQARQLLGQMLLDRQLRAKALERARETGLEGEEEGRVAADTVAGPPEDDDGVVSEEGEFVPMRKEINVEGNTTYARYPPDGEEQS